MKRKTRRKRNRSVKPVEETTKALFVVALAPAAVRAAEARP